MYIHQQIFNNTLMRQHFCNAYLRYWKVTENKRSDIMSLITDVTWAMVLVTAVLAIITVVSTILTQYQNKNLNKHNTKTLELMRASHKPTLFLDLFRKWKGGKNSTLTNDYIYWITVRNDGIGTAINVDLFYKFGRMPNLESREVWKSSEKDFELHYRGDNIGNISAGKTWIERFWPLEEDSNDLNSIYAVRLMANCEDIFGEKNYEVKRNIDIEDIKEISDIKEIPNL